MPRIKLFTTIDGALSHTTHSNCRPTVVVLPSSWIETNSIELIQNFSSCLSASFFLLLASPDTVGLFSFSRWGRRVKKINASYEAVTGQPVGASALMAPPGAPAQGMWVEERYCGITTWLICLMVGFPCSYFCPCDRRTVWISNRVKYNEKGAVTDDYLFLNPCPPGSVCHPNPENRF